MTTLKTRGTLPASAVVPRRRRAISLIRFSTPRQALGDSARRQYERAVAYCEANNLELVETIRDEGMSGLHGIHRKKGAFGRFVRRFLRGEIQVDVFIAEAFDRFTAKPVRIAQQLFLSLINGDESTHGGLEVVTLIDGKRYTAESIDHNVGELYTSIALMLGAHIESKNKGDRIHEVWNAPNGRRNGGIGKETGLPSNVFPAWIAKTKQGPKLDKAKAVTLHRIRKLVETKGCDQMAKLFNDEGVPTLNTRKRPGRARPMWDKTAIHKIIRGRQVLGEQAIGRYMDVKDPKSGETTFKRVLTGEVKTNAYPAVWTEEQWLTANHALDRRKRGVQTGRNATTYANMFGPLALCGRCGGIMKIRGRGRLGPFKYLGCSNSGVGMCRHKTYHRLDKVEADLFALISNLTWQGDTRDENLGNIDAQLTAIRGQMDKRQRNIKAMAASFADAPPAIRAEMMALAKEQEADQAAKAKLERQLATLRTAKPADEQLAGVQSLSERLERLSGPQLTEARGKIAMSLPALFRRLTFKPEGVEATVADGRKLKLGEWSGSVGGLIVGKKTPTTGLFARGIKPSGSIAPLRRPTEAEIDAAGKQSKKALNAYLKQKP